MRSSTKIIFLSIVLGPILNAAAYFPTLDPKSLFIYSSKIDPQACMLKVEDSEPASPDYLPSRSGNINIRLNSDDFAKNIRMRDAKGNSIPDIGVDLTENAIYVSSQMFYIFNFNEERLKDNREGPLFNRIFSLKLGEEAIFKFRMFQDRIAKTTAYPNGRKFTLQCISQVEYNKVTKKWEPRSFVQDPDNPLIYNAPNATWKLLQVDRGGSVDFRDLKGNSLSIQGPTGK